MEAHQVVMWCHHVAPTTCRLSNGADATLSIKNGSPRRCSWSPQGPLKTNYSRRLIGWAPLSSHSHQCWFWAELWCLVLIYSVSLRGSGDTSFDLPANVSSCSLLYLFFSFYSCLCGLIRIREFRFFPTPNENNIIYRISCPTYFMTVCFCGALHPSALWILLKVDYGTKMSTPWGRERERESWREGEDESHGARGKVERNMQRTCQPEMGQVWGRTCATVGVSMPSFPEGCQKCLHEWKPFCQIR